MPATPARAPADPAPQAAFFDFDKTLLHGDAGVLFGLTLVEWGYAQGNLLEDLRDRRLHRLKTSANIAATISKGALYRTLNSVGLIKRSKLIELTYGFLKGLPAGAMSERMERVWNDTLQARLYPEMREVLDRHRKEGRRIVIVTTGMRELVEHSKKALGEDIDVIGAEMQSSPDGLWLGKVTGPLYGVHKAEAVRAYAQRHGVDLSRSWAYSDHYSDLAFLGAVGNPVAVNPRLRLAILARKRGWRTMYVLPPVRGDR